MNGWTEYEYELANVMNQLHEAHKHLIDAIHEVKRKDIIIREQSSELKTFKKYGVK